ncbi:DUF4374 domain-containing protein [Dyadobacter sp. CY312]|uniref:DUF4374 domain-containing protein n=1 Tax=Dyadobacter sp. CY312 TaxID=2907303 RepID=UPI001F3368FB|nr:DUF4374 domain-containing protein [Dyadobacter sp. CY312]MCE7043305.1 DUF4374 domain-containing protein [Dyadobacter sp. CY312]
MTAHLRHLYLTLLTVASLAFTGCTDHATESSVKKKYSIYAMLKDGNEYLLQIDSLNSGIISPEKTGAKVVPPRIFHDLIVRDGYYYRLDMRTGKFSRSTVKNDVLTEEQSLQVDGFTTCQNYNWISTDSLLLIGYDEGTKKIRSARVNVRNMTAVQDIVDIDAPSGIYNSISIGFSKFSDGKLIVGYSYHTINGAYNYTTGDTVYVNVLGYPQMKSLQKLKDTRSTYPGDENTRQAHSFTDEKGDFYFISAPGIAGGNNPNKPTGIYRIQQSQTTLDQEYFFNISASPIQNHGYGLWYIGKGKAIIRTERKGIFSGMKDHWKVPHFDYYVIDLQSKTTSRLPLPLDKGTAKQCVMVENGMVYIGVNSDTEGSYVWMYNSESGDLKKGLKFDDKVDYILRLERLN